MNPQEKNTNPSAFSIGFTKYKLTRLRMEQLQDEGAKKLIFKIKLNNLAEPSTMKLWVYPAKNHKDYAEGKTGSEVPSYGISLFTDTTDILIGNTEVALKYFHQDNKLNKPWRDFSYATLEPARKGGDLVFTIRLDDSLLLTVDETNPSPPGKPEEA